MTILKQQLLVAENILLEQFKLTSAYRNPNTNGSIKEDFIRNEICQRLPTGVAFGKGEIVDSLSHKTGEHDLVGYDRNFASIFQCFGAHSTFFAESVFSCIEVKSRFDNSAIVDCAAKFSALATLERFYTPTNLSIQKKRIIGVGGFDERMSFQTRGQTGDIPRVVTAVIAFSSSAHSTIDQQIRAANLDADVVCVLGVGAWIREWNRNNFKFLPNTLQPAYYSFVAFLDELMASHLTRHLFARVRLLDTYI